MPRRKVPGLARRLLALLPGGKPRAARARHALPTYLQPHELEALLAAARGSSPRDHALLTVMAYAGLRVAEACALTWGDIEERTLRVRHGKGDKERIVPLHPRVLEALAECREIPQKRNIYVFPGQRPGRPLTTRAVQHLMVRLGTAAGLDRSKLHPHTLRHTAATMLLRRTGNLILVQRFLGHASVSTTQIYTHVALDELAAAVEQL